MSMPKISRRDYVRPQFHKSSKATNFDLWRKARNKRKAARRAQ